MHARTRVEERAERIYSFLREHLGERFTISQLCNALHIQDGNTTRAAIRRARDLATEAGLHFPPAVPASNFGYMITALPGDAIDPMLHMSRVEMGIRLRREDGEAFIRDRLKMIDDPEDRAHARRILRMQQFARKASATIQREADDYIAELVEARRERRS